MLRLTALAALAVACAAQPMAPLPRDVPASFDGNANAAATGAAGTSNSAAPWPAQDWYRGFASAELDGLIAAAAKNNLDLAAARARVAQADARARQAGSAILPTVDGVGNANYLAGHSAQGGGHEFDWSALLSASYEVDFWGKNRAIAGAARNLADASRAERDTVQLTTLAGVADGYFQVLALRERLDVARLNSEAAAQLLGVIQARFNEGAATPVELASQKAAADTAQIAAVELQQSAAESRAALSTLLGRVPESFEVQSRGLDSLSEPLVSAGLPSALLTRRPDVAVAEANLRAGHADVLVARAALFPNLSLTAAAGVQNPALPATVLTIPGVGPSFALGAGLVQPIFDHGRLKAQRDEVLAKDTELLTAYRAAIIAALVDVENALAAIQHLNAARDMQIDNVAQSQRAFDGAKLRYEAGSGDYLTLLEAQRTLYSARDQLIRYKLARLQALVSLCKALGGGWTQPAADSASRAAMVGSNN